MYKTLLHYGFVNFSFLFSTDFSVFICCCGKCAAIVYFQNKPVYIVYFNFHSYIVCICLNYFQSYIPYPTIIIWYFKFNITGTQSRWYSNVIFHLQSFIVHYFHSCIRTYMGTFCVLLISFFFFSF